MKTLKLLSTIFLLLVSLAFPFSQLQAKTTKPYVFFDLGEVLVHTEKIRQDNGELKRVISWMPGAKDYLDELKQKGFAIGIMTNIPTSWGNAPAEWGTPCESMFRRLSDYLQVFWREGEDPFNWSYFQRVIMPPIDEERKPDPFMYMNALAYSCPNQLLFIGEDSVEIDQAIDLGLSGWLTGSPRDTFFLEVSRLRQHVDSEFSYEYSNPCQRDVPRECSVGGSGIEEILARPPIPAPKEN